MAHPLLEPHSDGSALHVDDPSPSTGGRVTVFLRTPDDGCPPARRVWARYTDDGDPRHVPARPDRRVRGEQWWRAEIEIRNPVTRYRFVIETPTGVRWCSAAGTQDHPGPDVTDFMLLGDARPPAWSSDAVFYQIFPDRFARSSTREGRDVPPWALRADWDDPVIGRGPDTPRQLYGGDLDGVREHLDHVAALGANALYLTPIVTAPSNHRYNASTLTDVDPVLGGDAAYARLCEAVHRRGWHIVGDLTLNHVGDQHEWFRRALDDPDSPEHGMFYIDPGLDGGYEAWAGVPSLPKLNWNNAELRRRMIEAPDSAVRRRLDAPYHQDGWRIDVANMVGRRRHDDLTHDVARAARRALAASGRDVLLVAEHSHDASADLLARGWDATMAYAGFTLPVWSWLRDPDVELPLLGMPTPVPRLPGPEAMAALRSLAAVTPWVPWASSWSLLGSHDTARIRSVVRGRAEVEVAAGLMVTLPGVPMIFAGDEIGMTGAWGEDSRRPMPWDRPQEWDAAILRCYRELIALRHAHPALRHGGLRWAHVGDDAIAFLREGPDERLLVYAARGPGAPVRLPSGPLGTTVRGADAVYGDADLPPDPAHVTLPADGPAFRVWRLPDETGAGGGC